MLLFHFIYASWNPEKFTYLPQRHPDESVKGHRRDYLREDFEPVSVKESVDEEKNRRRNDPAVKSRRDRKEREPHLIAFRQERIVGGIHTQEPFRRLLRHRLRRFLAQVRNL